MRASLIIFVLVCLVASGCESEGPATQKRHAFESAAGECGVQEPESTALKGPSVIETHEIVRILENEAIEFVATTHAQTIFIRLKDGRQYKGTYVHAQAGRYAENKNLFDILNLVSYIQKKRPAEEVKDWIILCE